MLIKRSLPCAIGCTPVVVYLLLAVAAAMMMAQTSGSEPTAGTMGAAVREEWVRRYNGPANGSDGASAMAVDAAGDVYVTGSSCGSGPFPRCLDYLTVKYDAAGNELWVRRYSGPVDNEDYVHALAVDAEGNVYVTGESCSRVDPVGGCLDFDYATVKYDAAGNEIWVRRYDGPANQDDRAWGLVLDARGHVYVTGSTCIDPAGGCFNKDWVTLKYDASGNQVWVAFYDGPGNGGDTARAIAIDVEGNVYVTGQSWGVGTVTDYATVKYDPEGNELWTARYDGPANWADQATAIALDAAGNAYVTGTICVRFGPFVRDCTDFDYATLKYDADGNQLWAARYDHPEEFDHDRATALALDAAGNVHVTGWSAVTGFIGGVGIVTREDYATVKYDSKGNELWVARYDGPQSLPDLPTAITTDADGNVYVTGSSCTREGKIGNCLATDYLTVKYDPAGKLLWLARYTGPSEDCNAATALALDAAGNVYVTGRSDGGPSSLSDYATIKYVQK